MRLVAVSQPGAGAWLNAVPKHAPFRLPTCHMRVAVQRRLGLPLLAAAGSLDRRSVHGMAFDCYGDVAQNDGEAGHQTRHYLVLEAVAKVIKSVWGGRVRSEPQDYASYSTTRPDIAALGCGPNGQMMLGDTKIWDPVGGDGLANVRGAYVAMGNTRPAARAQVHGLRRRGDPSAAVWDWSAGSGFVPETDGQYTKAAELGCDVWCLLFETFGGFSPEVMALLKALTEERQNKLNSSEYDLTTWAARTWMSFSVQKISVAVQMASTGEIIHALGLAAAGDPRGG